MKMKKQIISLMTAVTVMLGTVSASFATSIPKDVMGTNVEDAVTRLGDLGVLTGYEDGTFKPEGNITRAEFAAVVTRVNGLEKAAESSMSANTMFADVSESTHKWATGYINVGAKTGLIKGLGEVNGVNIFGPNQNITYEQAVTMIVRALGYEPAALTNGGYPTGYLIVAAQEGLLKDIKADKGQLATRGLVAQLTDNALEIPKMIQVGYGDGAKFVKSGTEGTSKKFLFNELNLKEVEDTVIEADKSKQRIQIGNKSLKVKNDSFNYAGLKGLRVKALYNNNDELVNLKVKTDFKVKFDALQVTKDKEEIKLITEDYVYDVDKNAEIKINGKLKTLNDLTKGTEYNFAKVILNEFNDVKSIETYNLTDKILIESIKNNDVIGFDDELSDIDEYTIVKDGKEISINDLNKNDLILYDSNEKYAAVVTNKIKGQLDRIYVDSFKFEGKTYSNESVKYVSGNKLLDITENVLSSMKDSKDIQVYFDFQNNPVLIVSDLKEIVEDYAVIVEDPQIFSHRGSDFITFDFMNAEGKIIESQISLTGKTEDALVDKDIVLNADKTEMTLIDFVSKFSKGVLVKVSMDNKELNKIESIEEKTISKTIDLKDSYAEGFKLQDNTLIFWNDGSKANAANFDEFEIEKLKDIDSFNQIEKGAIYVDKYGKIVGVIATQVDMKNKTTWKTGLITDIRETSTDYYITLYVDGANREYIGDKADFVDFKEAFNKNDVVNLLVTKDGLVKEVNKANSDVMTLTKNATSTNLVGIIEGKGEVSLIVEGSFFDSNFDKARVSEFSKDSVVTVYYIKESSKFVNVVKHN